MVNIYECYIFRVRILNVTCNVKRTSVQKIKSQRHVLTDRHSTFAKTTGKAEKPHIDRVGKTKNKKDNG